MSEVSFNFIETDGAPIKAWTKGVPMADNAREQLRNVAQLPFIHSHVAAMPDVHLGIGATVGSVIATKGAVGFCNFNPRRRQKLKKALCNRSYKLPHHSA